jgi:hypothetical protein
LNDKNYFKISFANLRISQFAFFFFPLSYFLYYLSLEKCFEGIFLCSKKVFWIYRKIFQALFSSIISAILLEFMLLKLITKKHLIHVFIFLSCSYFYSHGQDFNDHGLYNLIGYIIIVITTLILIFPFKILFYLIKNKKKKLLFIYLSILIVLFFFYINLINSYLNCNDWHKGLNNTYIENDINKYGCQIKFPKFCPYKIGSNFLDLSKINKVRCGQSSTCKKKIMKFSNSTYINKKTKRFGYPLTNKDPTCLNRQNQNSSISLYVKNNLIDMDNKEILEKVKANIPEIIVDFSKNKFGELKINVNIMIL